MESLRVRVVFEDRNILSKSQRSVGLNRSWVFVKPQQLPTFSHLSAHLLNFFDLAQSCPHGLLLCMDGFVLPPFESTSILKDKDIISVKKRGGTLNKLLKKRKNADSIEDSETKQQLDAGVPHDKKEAGSSEVESEDDADCSDNTEPSEKPLNSLHKERKASTEPQNSKKKKRRVLVPNGNEKDNQTKSSGGQGLILKKVSLEKPEKVSNSKCKQIIKPSQPTQQCVQESTKSMSDDKSDQLKENDKRTGAMSNVTSTSIKVPSRSARRKKAKREWLRATANLGKKKTVCISKLPLKRKQRQAEAEKKEVIDQSKVLPQLKQSEQEKPENEIDLEKPFEKIDGEDEFVPVVIRPGHIRFEPLEEGEIVQQNKVCLETIRWNGITSKRKGQKWGMEKISSSDRHEHQNLEHDQPNTSSTTERVMPVHDPIDFEKLHPLPNLPKVGDVIAYRILELSSTWTPEVSSFRVGSVLWYKPESKTVMLTQVPEYPVIREKLNEDASAPQPDNSIYNEDGSLQVDFSSLIDVRIVKHGDSDCLKPVAADHSNGDSFKVISDEVSNSAPTNTDGVSNSPKAGNGEVNLLDQFSDVLNAKKAQLYEENSWIKGSPVKGSWSYRAMRGSALGPVMALLRSNNDI
ncbi:coilin isoform X2 [Daucus carota subsp. sativus]|uniref:coilin isoform X2 n=1 Tax=Daucus carota subsp. sativus TaxID=79200 RepID=UPI0007F03CA0|nr:PREDICTED: coilin-like isoform X2 [Daucus carota subsp. sativus]